MCITNKNTNNDSIASNCLNHPGVVMQVSIDYYAIYYIASVPDAFPYVLHLTGIWFSKVGGASGKASGRIANTNEFRGGKAIRFKLYH